MTEIASCAPRHKSAVVIIPPEEIWEPIQKIRRLYDRQCHRWMPHITLIYPFRPRSELERAVAVLSGRVDQGRC